MLDIYICEDNKKQLEFIVDFISDYCIFRNLDARIVTASIEPDDIIAEYKNNQNPALFFLDIDLGAQISGIELASYIRKQGKKAFIVFLTSHSEMSHLTFQYKLEALDYIVKDSRNNIKKRIAECINTAFERHAGGDKSKTLKINTGDKTVYIDLSEIIFIETTSIRHKLRLHTANRVLELNGELKMLEEQLDDRFIRCHKSYIINKDKISVYNKKENTVTMIDNNICPISRNGKKLL